MKKIKIFLPIMLLIVLIVAGLQLQARAPSKILSAVVGQNQNHNKTPVPVPQTTWPVSNYSYFPQPSQSDVADIKNPDNETLLAQIPPEVLATLPMPLNNKEIRVSSIKELMNSFRRSIPSDISPEERKKVESEIEQMETQAFEVSRQLRMKGYLDIDSGEIKDFEEVKTGAKPMEELPETTFNPSNISSLEARGLKFEGARALHQEGEKAILLTRIFKTATGGEIQLTETERQGATLQKEMVNENINGQPAIYVTKKSSDGKELKELICFSDKKTYELKTNDATVDLAAIARSIRD